MSTALAIAGVTQLLRDVLNDGIVDNDVAAAIGTNVTVHARAPDLLQEVADGASILNVFCYQVDNQTNWSNQILPTRTPDGTRAKNTPLTLDLFYLISAAATEDLHADILMGYAMQVLHEHPGFDRDEMQTGLNPAPAIAGGLPPALQALAQTGLENQIEQLVISPQYLGVEEMSKLWTAFQTSYRSSMTYRVSSVIIEAETPQRAPLPVLTIGPDNAGVQVSPSLAVGRPMLRALILPEGQPSARPGDVITLRGNGLEGVDLTVRFETNVLSDPIDVVPDPGGSQAVRTVTLPDVPAAWAAGQFRVTFLARAAPGASLFSSNSIAFQLAPVPDLPPAAAARNPDGTVEVTLGLRPNIHPGQRVELAIGGDIAAAPARTTAQSQASFTLPDLPAGDYPLRLRIDGVESWLIQREVPPGPPDFEPEPPIFDPTQVITVPA
ncbi:MAG: DUF4255 domain-containing protein [Pseudomonadota bacterium]